MFHSSANTAATVATSWRARVYELIEASETRTRWAALFDAFIIVMIMANVAAVVLETVDHLGATYKALFDAFDMFSVIVFTIEYLTRMWVVVESADQQFARPFKGRLRYSLTPMAIIDLLAIAPFYLSWFLPIDLRFLRVFRLLRLLKLTRYSPALETLWAAVYTQRRALAAAFVVILVLLVFASSIIYLLEHEAQPVAFASIPHAMWWGLATLTTVGYGDVAPITGAGKVFGGLIMVLGIGMFALPAGILATAFADELRKREFVANWRMVASVPLFSHLDALRIADIVSRLELKILPPNYAVFDQGDTADAMYFISVGVVEVEIPNNPHGLEAGDFFGEIALIQDGVRTATVRTKSECQLMALNVRAFQNLLMSDPDLREHLVRTSEERLRELKAQGTPDIIED